MIKTIENKFISLSFVFRHRWEKDNDWEFRPNRYEAGIFFEKRKVVGKATGSLSFIFSDGNHALQYILGIELFVFKAWIKIGKPALKLTIENNKIC